MVETCHSTFVQSHRITPPRVIFNKNYELWVILMCQYRFINCSKCTTLMRDIDNGGGCTQGGAGSI